MQIQFKLIPVRYTTDDDSEYLVQDIGSFLTVPVSQKDYGIEVQVALNWEFGPGCVIARSFWVENTETGLNIYTLVSVPYFLEKKGYEWVGLEKLKEYRFDDYDQTAVNFLDYRRRFYGETSEEEES